MFVGYNGCLGTSVMFNNGVMLGRISILFFFQSLGWQSYSLSGFMHPEISSIIIAGAAAWCLVKV